MQTKRRIRTPEGVQQQARALRKTMTRAEQILWNRLRDRQLGGVKFRRQAPLGPFIVDFYCPEVKLVIELDGAVHHSQKEQDQQRTQFLAELGCRLIRFPNDAVEKDLKTVLTRILLAVENTQEE